jgi:hypothetical protein
MNELKPELSEFTFKNSRKVLKEKDRKDGLKGQERTLYVNAK